MLTIRVSPELYNAFKILACQLGQSMNETAVQALHQAVLERKIVDHEGDQDETTQNHHPA